MNERVSKLSQTLGLSAKDAALRVRTIDRERVDFVQDHFHHDPRDPRQYDLVLNVGRLTAAAQAGLIMDALDSLQGCSAERELEEEQRCSSQKSGPVLRASEMSEPRGERHAAQPLKVILHPTRLNDVLCSLDVKPERDASAPGG